MGKTLNAVGKLRQHKAARMYEEFAARYLRALLKVLEKQECDWIYSCEEYEAKPLGDEEGRPCLRCNILTEIEEEVEEILEEK